jgi:hypothetical protein
MLRVDRLDETGAWAPGIDYYWHTSDAVAAARRLLNKTGRATRVVYPFEGVWVMHEFAAEQRETARGKIDMADAVNQVFGRKP